jgi:hypothetical protein
MDLELQDLQRHQPANIEAETDAAVNELWTMAEEFEKADPALLRELIRRMVARIDVKFGEVRQGKQIKRPVTGGTLSLRPDPNLSVMFNSGCRRKPIKL